MTAPKRYMLIALLALLAIGAGAWILTRDADTRYPKVRFWNELSDDKLIAALRGGGHVLFIRHAEQIPGGHKGPCDGKSLSEKGQKQARQLGAALRSMKVPVGKMYASETCRAQETGKLFELGNVEITSDLNRVYDAKTPDTTPQRKRRLAELPAPRANTILLSHSHDAPAMSDKIELDVAEVIVYKPDGKGDATAVARVPLARWDALMKFSGASAK